MPIVYSLRVVLASMLLAAGTTQAGLDDLFKSAGELVQPMSSGSTAGVGLSDAQISSGLKEALNVGAERAIGLLGKPGGFLNDAEVRIPLPGMLDTAAKGLRAAGQGAYVDEFENTVNRAAEQAIPKTLDIVQETVSSMTLDDARAILSGGDDAATRFLEQRAGPSLQAAIKPIVASATDSAGATAAYKQLKSQADGMMGGLGGLLGSDSLDLDSYVTDKTLDGLFTKLAKEEAAIRQDPVARSTDLLKQVFAN